MNAKLTPFLTVCVLSLWCGVALAATGIATSPGEMAVELLGDMRSAQYLPAVGVAMMLVVWALRAGLAAWFSPWFAGAIGGYVVAYATASLSYAGVALAAHQGPSFGLAGAALAAGWAASGGWEHFRDFVGWLRSKTLATSSGVTLAQLRQSAELVAPPPPVGFAANASHLLRRGGRVW